MPTEGAYGRCGCPEGFNPLGNTCVPGGQICYSSDAEEREENGLACAFRWFTQSWWNDAFNQDLLDCFADHLNDNPENNPTQSHCSYIEYNGVEYKEYQDIEVY